ncbi:MAG: ABC transporter permease [Pseudomonadota bacterium]
MTVDAIRPGRPAGLLRRTYRRSPPAIIGGGLLVVLAFAAVAAPWLTPYAPETMDFNAPLAGPTASHPFGTDNFGRDVLSRVLHGYRVSLAVAIGSVAMALVVAIPLGLVAGYYQRWLDNVIMRPMDVIMAFPAIVLVVAMAGFFGQGLVLMMLALAIVYVPIIVRVMRGAALGVAGELFVEGARARGASDLRIMVRHVLPNAITPVFVQASVLMGIAILLEAALSFIGLGVEPPTPSLGLMLAEGRSFMGRAPWLVIAPGLAIVLAVLGFNLLGNGLPALSGPRRGR